MNVIRRAGLIINACLLLGAAALAADSPKQTQEKTEHFDVDPHWEGVNNRPDRDNMRTVEQKFGYSRTRNTGGGAGEIGGLITPAAEPAYYARNIGNHSFADTLTASGTLICPSPKFHVLIGFFNSGTVNEWRTPNTIALRLLGRGDSFFPFVEYATQKWRAGADSPGGFATEVDSESGKKKLKGFALKQVYHWSIKYDPLGNAGDGTITVTLGDQTSVCNLSPGHKMDGATFNRFGLLNVMKSAVKGAQVWIGDVVINGKREDLANDPHWEGRNNNTTYDSPNVRPHSDYGYSPTHYAGGSGNGEFGGNIFRGDCRSKDTLSCCGDVVDTLTLNGVIKASGRVCLRRGVSDSAVLIGFYNSKASMAVSKQQASMMPKSFLGVCIEGPSREGFQFYPVYSTHSLQQSKGRTAGSPHIYPDGKSHSWSMIFDPQGANGNGTMAVTLDDNTTTLDLLPGHRSAETQFNRFGIVTTWIDGNGQQVFLDDLTYTCRQGL